MHNLMHNCSNHCITYNAYMQYFNNSLRKTVNSLKVIHLTLPSGYSPETQLHTTKDVETGRRFLPQPFGTIFTMWVPAESPMKMWGLLPVLRKCLRVMLAVVDSDWFKWLSLELPIVHALSCVVCVILILLGMVTQHWLEACCNVSS